MKLKMSILMLGVLKRNNRKFWELEVEAVFLVSPLGPEELSSGSASSGYSSCLGTEKVLESHLISHDITACDLGSKSTLTHWS